MPADYGLHLVYDADDMLEHQELLTGLQEIDQGRLVIEAPPDGRRFIAVADQVFAAMGKDIDNEGSGRSSAESWRLLLVWLLAEKVEHLFVSRAHLLDRRQWELLFGLAGAANVRLWLITQAEPLRRGLREAVKDWPLQVSGFDEFAGLWREELGTRAKSRKPQMPPKIEANRTFPEVPVVDFPTFRQACATLLNAREFAVVDGTYVRGFSAAGDWPADSPETVLRCLVSCLDGAQSFGEVLVSLRAAQSALLRRGWFLSVDPGRLELASQEALSRSIDEDMCAELRRYVHPVRAGAAVLALVSGWTPGRLARMRVGDLELNSGANEVCMQGESWELPINAMPAIRALMTERSLAGAGRSDALFATGHREQLRPITTSALRWWLRRMTNETGLPLARSWNVDADEDVRWRARQMGVRLAQL